MWVWRWWSGRVSDLNYKGFPTGYLVIAHGNNTYKESLSLVFYQNISFEHLEETKLVKQRENY